MTAVAIEVMLPADSQSPTGVMEYRGKLAEAATELGQPHTADTVCRLAGNVPVNIALQREKLPVGVALHWEVDSDRASIYRVLASLRDQFDCQYTAVDGVLVAADDPELLAAKLDLNEVCR